eukprot:2536466-Rhodomonas_salina.1
MLTGKRMTTFCASVDAYADGHVASSAVPSLLTRFFLQGSGSASRTSCSRWGRACGSCRAAKRTSPRPPPSSAQSLAATRSALLLQAECTQCKKEREQTEQAPAHRVEH